MIATPYTDEQATDEAIRLLTRKLHRLHPDVYADVLAKLPDGAREALNAADIRADRQRADDARDGVTRRYVLIEERAAAEIGDVDEADTDAA